MKTMIISGGNIEFDFALDFILKQKADCLIAADRGIEFMDRSGMVPDWIVGDFDSGSREALERFKKKGVPVRAFKPQKDSTDTEIAVQLALEAGSTEMILLGATGSRLDHVLGSIRNLSIPMRAGVPCFLVDAHNRIRMTEKPVILRKDEQYGKYVSVLAHGGTVEDLTLKGFFYPLNRYTMTADDAIGISNEIVEEQAEILFGKGCVLVIESKD